MKPIEKKIIQNAAPITDSVILHDTVSELMELIQINKTDRYFLLYRGSRDGFGAKDFHSNCDFIPNTLTIVKVGSNIFGGFTSATWDGAPSYKQDNEAFIFSLRNNMKNPVLMKVKHPKAIYVTPANGPTFGGGHDFVIYDQSNINGNSLSSLGYSYQFDLHAYGSAGAKSFLAGSYNFRVDEIEVYVRL